MQMVSTLGFPSSNQLSGCTSRSWIREKMTIGPIAEIGWMSGPPKIEPVREHQPGSQARRQAVAVAVLPGGDLPRDRRPAGSGSAVVPKPTSSASELGARASSIPPQAIQHCTSSWNWLAISSPFTSHRRLDPIGGSHLTEEGHRAGVLDPNLDRSPDQPLVSFENHDPITRRSAGQLVDAVPSFTPGRGSAPPFNQDSHLAADELAIVLQADGRLHGQKIVVPPLLDLLGNVVGEQLIGLRPLPRDCI